MIKAIILAAGRGSRLGNLTNDRPKGMVAFAGKPLLEWQMKALREAGISDITIVKGYKEEAIPFNVNYVENKRWQTTNMVASLLCAREILRNNDCIISYADIIYPANPIDDLINSTGGIRISFDTNWKILWQKRFNDPLSDAETFQTDSAGILTEIGNKPKKYEEISGQYMGLLYISKEGWQSIESLLSSLQQQEIDALDMTTLLRKLIHSGVIISTVPYHGAWGEIDSGSDLATMSLDDALLKELHKNDR